MKRIAATDLIRNIGTFLRHAAEGPVTVTSHGRDNSVLISATAYRQLVARQAPATTPPTGGSSADPTPERDAHAGIAQKAQTKNRRDRADRF